MNGDYYKRGWLNAGKGVAMFEATIDLEGNINPWLSASFRLTDCNRGIGLDFTPDYGDDISAPIAKIDLLMKELFEFKQALILASEEYRKLKGDADNAKL